MRLVHLQDGFAPATFVGVPPLGPPVHVPPFESQDGRREQRAEHLHAQPAVTPSHAHVHQERVDEPFPGEFYGVCSCDARSGECDRRQDAAAWTCPVKDALIEVARNRDAFQRRLLAATFAGRVR